MEGSIVRTWCIIALILAPAMAFAQAEVITERSPQLTTLIYKCRQASDLTASGVPGFLQIYAGGDPQLEAIHLPVREIVSITGKRNGLQINFTPQPSGIGAGFLERVILVPLDVQPPARVLELL